MTRAFYTGPRRTYTCVSFARRPPCPDTGLRLRGRGWAPPPMIGRHCAGRNRLLLQNQIPDLPDFSSRVAAAFFAASVPQAFLLSQVARGIVG